jgi:hypothetical protein
VWHWSRRWRKANAYKHGHQWRPDLRKTVVPCLAFWWRRGFAHLAGCLVGVWTRGRQQWLGSASGASSRAVNDCGNVAQGRQQHLALPFDDGGASRDGRSALCSSVFAQCRALAWWRSTTSACRAAFPCGFFCLCVLNERIIMWKQSY